VCDEEFNSRATFAFLDTIKGKYKPGKDDEFRFASEMEKQMVIRKVLLLTGFRSDIPALKK
jgi:hypothetical protein